jgi:hypothetical protein
MNNKDQELGALRGPLIPMVPASNLVAVMSLDWLDGTNQAAVFRQTDGRNYLANPPRTPKDFGRFRGDFCEPSRAAQSSRFRKGADNVRKLVV